MISTIENIIKKCLKENPCELELRKDEPMSEHTTFKVGGKADFYLRPSGDSFPDFCANLFRHTRTEQVPVFILGGGANIVVSDKGIRGIVLDVSAWKGKVPCEELKTDPDRAGEPLALLSGTTLDEAADIACNEGLCGLEFLAGMPGTVGGALWMNARCYGIEIADVLLWADVIDISNPDKKLELTRFVNSPAKDGFDYKKSPFQEMDCLIMTACFNLKKGDKTKIKTEMEKNRSDRKEKGHYLFPSAGSAFKNDRSFGKPTGQIIDELGLKSFSIGGAQIAPFHGNIVINSGSATAADIRNLVNEITAKVKSQTGFVLEPEILFTGEW